MDMPRRRLGQSGLEVSALGLGCMGMSEFYGPGAGDESSIATIHHALAIGVHFFDTADMYGSGKNEELLGRALRGRRREAIIATKFGNVRGPDGSFQGINGRPTYVKQACDASLRRLGIETIDLYYQHRVDANVPIEDTVGAMAELVEVGKVRYLGLSEASVATLRRAHATHPITALQTEYSLWSREPEAELLGACHELGIGFVAYSPLGRGFLTGRFQTAADFDPSDYRRQHPRFLPEAMEKNRLLADRVKTFAAQRGCTPAQLALAWVLAQGDDIVPIPGTRQVKYLEENAAAARLTLTPSELEEISAALPAGSTAGDRYPPGGMAAVNR